MDFLLTKKRVEQGNSYWAQLEVMMRNAAARKVTTSSFAELPSANVVLLELEEQ